MRLAVFSALAIFAPALASAAGEPTFDVASVKLASPDLRPPFTVTGGPGTNDPGRFSAPSIGMQELLMRAFGVANDQLMGPGLLRTNQRVPENTRFTVTATMPGNTSKEQFQKMLQNMLIERFHLTFHHEIHPFPGYDLMVDKGGPKLKEITATQAATPEAERDPRAVLTAPRGEDGFPKAPGPRRFSISLPGGQARWKFQEWTMADFAVNLQPLILSSQGKLAANVFPRPPSPRVADKTGLTGKYTFILEYYDVDEANLNLAGLFGRIATTSDPANGALPVASEPGNGFPSIFVALQKQLGLRLDKTPDIPMDVIVVDSVDKLPAEN